MGLFYYHIKLGLVFLNSSMFRFQGALNNSVLLLLATSRADSLEETIEAPWSS